MQSRPNVYIGTPQVSRSGYLRVSEAVSAQYSTCPALRNKDAPKSAAIFIEHRRVPSLRNYARVTPVFPGLADLVKHEIIHELELCTFENTRSIPVCLHACGKKIRTFIAYSLPGTPFVFREICDNTPVTQAEDLKVVPLQAGVSSKMWVLGAERF